MISFEDVPVFSSFCGVFNDTYYQHFPPCCRLPVGHTGNHKTWSTRNGIPDFVEEWVNEAPTSISEE